MLLKYYFMISLSLCIGCAEIITLEEMAKQNVQEGSTCDEKVTVALSILKSIPEKFEKTIERKLYTLEKKIPEKLEEYLDCKLDVLVNLEDSIDLKLYKLEKKLLDRLELFIDRKLNALENNNPDKVAGNIESKLEVLGKKISDIDENINNKFDTLANKTLERKDDDINRKMESIEEIPVLENSAIYCKTNMLEQKKPESENNIENKLAVLEKAIIDLNENIEQKLDTLVNTTIGKHYDDINRKLNKIEKLPDLENMTKHFNTNNLDKKVSQLEENLNHKLEVSAKMIPDLETNLVRKLNALDRKIPESFEENIRSKLSFIEKKILDLQDTNKNKLSSLEIKSSEIEKNIGNKLDVIQKKLPDYNDNFNKKFYALQSSEKKMFDELRRAHDSLLCKEQVVHGYNYRPLYRIDNSTLSHVMLKTDSAGVLHFEMRISVKAAKEAIILLSPSLEPRTKDRVYEIVLGVGGYNDRTQLRLNLMDNLAQDRITPNILSPTHFTSFTIQIANGKLRFNQEGFLPSVIHIDNELNSVKYFGFASWGENQATILYDCPTQNL